VTVLLDVNISLLVVVTIMPVQPNTVYTPIPCELDDACVTAGSISGDRN
jgi:hypothetical protein